MLDSLIIIHSICMFNFLFQILNDNLTSSNFKKIHEILLKDKSLTANEVSITDFVLHRL